MMDLRRGQGGAGPQPADRGWCSGAGHRRLQHGHGAQPRSSGELVKVAFGESGNVKAGGRMLARSTRAPSRCGAGGAEAQAPAAEPQPSSKMRAADLAAYQTPSASRISIPASSSTNPGRAGEPSTSKRSRTIRPSRRQRQHSANCAHTPRRLSSRTELRQSK